MQRCLRQVRIELNQLRQRPTAVATSGAGPVQLAMASRDRFLGRVSVGCGKPAVELVASIGPPASHGRGRLGTYRLPGDVPPRGVALSGSRGLWQVGL